MQAQGRVMPGARAFLPTNPLAVAPGATELLKAHQHAYVDQTTARTEVLPPYLDNNRLLSIVQGDDLVGICLQSCN